MDSSFGHSLPTLTLEVTYKALEDVSLPEYSSSTIRGGFGSMLRRTCCIGPASRTCKQCMISCSCAYARIFESVGESRSGIEDAPRPFVVRPVLANPGTFRKDETFSFEVVLIGKAIEYVPHVIVTMERMGLAGLGKRRGKARLKKVVNATRDLVVYDHSIGELNEGSLLPDKVDDLSSLDLEHRASFDFLTPYRSKIRGTLVSELSFVELIRSLSRRIELLDALYGHKELKLDRRSLVAAASSVRTVGEATSLHWRDWERYSSRQGTKMRFGGLVGIFTVEGELAPFGPLLLYGQRIHAGKQTTFGLGWYRILEGRQTQST